MDTNFFHPVFSVVFEVIGAAWAYMKVTLVPGTGITFLQLWMGALASTVLIDALKEFLPNQNEDSQ